MIKYTMLLHHQDKEAFTEKLMDLGLVQIHGYETTPDDETEELSQIIRETEEAIRRFKRRKVKINGKAPIKSSEFPSLAEIAEMEKQAEHVQHELEALNIEIRLLEPWGDFDRQALKKIEERTGYEAKFFEYPQRKFNYEWQHNYALQLINTVNGIHYFVIFRKPDEELPLSPVALPAQSLASLKQKRDELQRSVKELNSKLDDYAANLSNGLSYRLTEAKDQLNLHLARKAVKEAGDETLSIVEAWCPKSQEQVLKDFLGKEKIVYLSTLPGNEDAPPVLLRNNAFSRLFEPIGALFSLPRYNELDLTVFFAPFFLLFFGLCLGDLGYGVVITLLATFLKIRKSSINHDLLTLVQFLGLSTIFAGIISGTLFGLEMVKIDYFKNLESIFLDYNKLFNLALIIGFIQIIFGIGVQAYKLWIYQGFQYALSKIGWILLLISLADRYLIQLIPPVSQVLIWIALGCIVIFGAPEKGWLKSIGFGLTDLYNITGVFGDLLSYIRLFALGVSSAILGIVVNSIALSAKSVPYVGLVLFAVVLIIGHTANLLLSSLSAFVHPMRLTFVEFYKNSGFMGGGKPFTPLARKTENQTSTQ
jgi:V/A-type H+-transporting ATPase subunit I